MIALRTSIPVVRHIKTYTVNIMETELSEATSTVSDTLKCLKCNSDAVLSAIAILVVSSLYYTTP